MKCENYKKLLSLYIDDMLSISEREDLELHLENCSSCLEDLRVLESIKKSLANNPKAELPMDFHSDLMKRINSNHKKENNKNQLNKLFISLGVIAASFLIFIVSKDFLPISKIRPKVFDSDHQMQAPTRITPHEQSISFELKAKKYDELKNALLSLIEDMGLKENLLLVDEVVSGPGDLKQLVIEVNILKKDADKFYDGIYKAFKKTETRIENDVVWKFKNPEEKIIFYVQEVVE